MSPPPLLTKRPTEWREIRETRGKRKNRGWRWEEGGPLGIIMGKQKVIGGKKKKAKFLSWHQKCMASEAILILTVTTDIFLYEKMNMRHWVFDSDKRYKACMPTGSGSIDCLSPRKLKGHYWSCMPSTLGLRVSCLWGPEGDRLPLASLEQDFFIWGKIL